MDKPAWPGLDDPQIKSRAGEYARRNGLWDGIVKRIAAVPLIQMPRSLFREFNRTGDQRHREAAMYERDRSPAPSPRPLPGASRSRTRPSAGSSLGLV